MKRPPEGGFASTTRIRVYQGKFDEEGKDGFLLSFSAIQVKAAIATARMSQAPLAASIRSDLR
jgi:hypothetical protein